MSVALMHSKIPTPRATSRCVVDKTWRGQTPRTPKTGRSNDCAKSPAAKRVVDRRDPPPLIGRNPNYRHSTGGNSMAQLRQKLRLKYQPKVANKENTLAFGRSAPPKKPLTGASPLAIKKLLPPPTLSVLGAPHSAPDPSARGRAASRKELRKRVAEAKNKVALALNTLEQSLHDIDYDLGDLTTRSSPAEHEEFNKRVVPLLSLGKARELVHEETAEGAQEVDYIAEAQMIAAMIEAKKQKETECC